MGSCCMDSPVVEEAQGWWDQTWAWFDEHSALMTWLFVASIASLLLVLALLPVVVVRLPADYFDPARPSASAPRTVLGWIGRVLLNVIGWVFLLVGLAMLVLPGQGLLTMLIGLVLVDLPGKLSIERRILARPSILGIINRMRERRGVPPLIVD